jgi:ATP-dependent Lhr-like helicase
MSRRQEEESSSRLNLVEAGLSLFSPVLRRQIEKLGWSSLTEIQVRAFKPVLEGEDVLLIAPTGTGKTEAAIIPIFELLLRARARGDTGRILYVTPLRALNRDIFRRLAELAEAVGISVAVRHGDTTPYMRRMQILKPPDMLITTPETLQSILPGFRLREYLKNVRWVVVDEIHELATDKRGAQLSIGLERLRELTGRDFQRIGLSATIGSPSLVAQFLSGSGKEARVVKAEEPKEIKVRVESPTPTDEDERLARKLLLSAGSVKRIRRLLELVKKHRSVLIFTNTREHAEALSSRIKVVDPSVKVEVHHGSLSRDVRVETEKRFKEGELNAVIATSSLELGIDVGLVDFVVQYLSPRQVTRFLQRVGRSGHMVGARPEGCIVSASSDDILESMTIAKFAISGKLEEPKIHMKALDALAHQIQGIVLDFGRVRIEDAFKIVTRAYPYSDLTMDEFKSVLVQLDRQRVVKIDGELVRRYGIKTFKSYFENLSMIPDVKRYTVFDFIRKKKIGSLDQEFIARHGEPGVEFILYGHNWRIVRVDEERAIVEVEAVTQRIGAIPGWEGEMIPVPFEVAQEVGAMRRMIAGEIEKAGDQPLFLEPLLGDQEALQKAAAPIEAQVSQGFPLPTDKSILVECLRNFCIIHACFGDLVNRTLGHILAALLSSRFGVNVGVQSDPYRIALIAPIHLTSSLIREQIEGLDPSDLEHILTTTLSDTNLLAWKMWHVGKKFGVVERDAEFRQLRARSLAHFLSGTPIHREAIREILLEKMDLERAAEALASLKTGEFKIEYADDAEDCSPLALPMLDKIAPQDLLRPAAPLKAVVEIVKERLESEQVRLVCGFKGDWDSLRSVRTLPEVVRCPKCGTTLVAVTHAGDTDLRGVVERKMSGKKLSQDEEKRWQAAWRSASLVQTYGRKGVVAQAARGVGPATAVRILNKMQRSDDEFYMDILAAERTYARTRMYWDS